MWKGLFNAGSRVYLDYAGAMPVLPKAQRAFRDALPLIGNPGALHTEAQTAAVALAEARASIAADLGCKAREIIFTSGGTEGNNLAILGWCKRLALEGKLIKETHWIVSAIEHPSVLACFMHIREMGGMVSVLATDDQGRIREETLTSALRPETVCVSIGWANGEIGVLQPLAALSQVIRAYEKKQGTRIILHSDAGQAPLYLSPQVHTLGVDLMTLDGGKLGSPRGIGALFIKSGTHIAPLLYGGGQEGGMRPGTENVALAVGFAAAFREASDMRKEEAARLEGLHEHLVGALLDPAILSGAIVNGSERHHLPHIVNVSIPNIDNEYLTLALDRAGFALATKSACKEGERASDVILAITEKDEAWRATSALRISMGWETRKRDIDAFLKALRDAVAAYRLHN